MNPDEEIFDVVDEEDVVISQAPRSEVHRLGLRHRAVHVLVFSPQGLLFLQKRSATKDCFPGCWDSSASGHLDQGESYDACAIRELAEELGIHMEVPPRRLFYLEASERTGQEFCWVYRMDHSGPFVLHPEEIETGDWFAPETIDSWILAEPEVFAPAFILIWETLQLRER